MVTIERCKCGHRACQDHWLVGAGKFVQGSGFGPREAQLIADLLNENRRRHQHAVEEDKKKLHVEPQSSPLASLAEKGPAPDWINDPLKEENKS